MFIKIIDIVLMNSGGLTICVRKTEGKGQLGPRKARMSVTSSSLLLYFSQVKTHDPEMNTILLSPTYTRMHTYIQRERERERENFVQLYRPLQHGQMGQTDEFRNIGFLWSAGGGPSDHIDTCQGYEADTQSMRIDCETVSYILFLNNPYK